MMLVLIRILARELSVDRERGIRRTITLLLYRFVREVWAVVTRLCELRQRFSRQSGFLIEQSPFGNWYFSWFWHEDQKAGYIRLLHSGRSYWLDSQ